MYKCSDSNAYAYSQDVPDISWEGFRRLTALIDLPAELRGSPASRAFPKVMNDGSACSLGWIRSFVVCF